MALHANPASTIRFDGVITAERRSELRAAFRRATDSSHLLIDVCDASAPDATLGLELLMLSQRLSPKTRLTIVTTSGSISSMLGDLGLEGRANIVKAIA